MTVIDPAPRTREERAAETRALLDRLRVRNGRERWRADVYLLSGGLADALPAPLAGDAWFDVDGCRAPPRERWRALVLGCAPADIETEARSIVSVLIGSYMAGFPGRPTANELCAAMYAGAPDERARRIVRALFQGMDTMTGRPSEAALMMMGLGLSARDFARPLRSAGVTNPVVTHWLNDWALRCREPERVRSEAARTQGPRRASP